MELEVAILERVRNWESQNRWERSELGRDLRRAGLSYREIMGMIPVKKSTLATWCRDVRLTLDQIEATRKRTSSEAGIPRDTQRERRAEIELIREQALLEAEHLMDESLWTAGVALYWGEGFKTQGDLGMANGDPSALRLFMKWADRYLIPSNGYRARLNIHADNDEIAARIWWASQLGLTLADFTKSFVKPDGTGHRKNHLPNGICMVRKRKSADAFHTTMTWVDFLQNRLGR